MLVGQCSYTDDLLLAVTVSYPSGGNENYDRGNKMVFIYTSEIHFSLSNLRLIFVNTKDKNSKLLQSLR